MLRENCDTDPENGILNKLPAAFFHGYIFDVSAWGGGGIRPNEVHAMATGSPDTNIMYQEVSPQK